MPRRKKKTVEIDPIEEAGKKWKENIVKGVMKGEENWVASMRNVLSFIDTCKVDILTPENITSYMNEVNSRIPNKEDWVTFKEAKQLLLSRCLREKKGTFRAKEGEEADGDEMEVGEVMENEDFYGEV